MNIIFSVLVFFIGAIFGSFLKVVADRYNTGMTLGGRSLCFSCRKTLTWRELIPVLSFILQKGQCRFCKSKMEWSYLISEVSTGLLFLAAYLKTGLTIETGILLIAFSLLVIIVQYDLKHTIIPDRFVFPFAGIALLSVFISQNSFVIPNDLYSALLAGPTIALPLFLLWLVSQGRWMGLGDSKLVLGLGWILGMKAGFSALIVSFWIGAGVSVFILIINSIWGKRFLKHFGKGLTIKSEIPFAPFLVLGFLLTFFFEFMIFLA